MTSKKHLAEKIPLAGGISLLPGKVVKNSPRTFVPDAIYSLGQDAFCVELKSLAYKVFIFTKLHRLEEIAQLQFLSVLPLNGHAIRGLYPHTFGHNRLIHSFRVAAVSLVMGKTLELSYGEMGKLLVSGLLHDAFTCAGGDSWKDINHQGTLFDEDNDFAKKIFRYFGDGWRTLSTHYDGFDPESAALEIADVVSGKGLLGGIQEIADTASYMLGDLEEIRKSTRRHKNQQDFARILLAAERPWDVWNHVSVCEGKVVVTDSVTLNNFLMLRVLLWADFYQNPRVKYLEMLLQKIVYPHLVDKNLIKIHELPLKNDKYLRGVIGRQMGWADVQIQHLDVLGAFPKLEAFADWDEALVFEEEKYRAGAATLIYDARQFPSIKSKVEKYHVIGENGSSQTSALAFAHAYPTRAEAIEEIARLAMAPDKPVQVAWVENPKISDNYRRAWEAARLRWHKK